MPRFPGSSSTLSQTGFESQRMGEDRKARKAQQRQGLLSSILGASTSLIGTGANLFSDLNRTRAQRDIAGQREAGDTARLGTELGARRDIADLDRAAQYPDVITPVPDGGQGPPTIDPLNVFKARTDRQREETEAKRGPLDEQLAKAMLAMRAGNVSRLGGLPLSKDQMERGERGEITGTPDPEVDKIGAMDALLRNKGIEDGLIPKESGQRTREEFAQRFGILAEETRDPFALKLYADRIAESSPGGLPSSEPEGLGERLNALVGGNQPSPIDVIMSKMRGGLNAQEQRESRNELLDLMKRVRTGPGVTVIPEFNPKTRQYISGKR